MLYAINFMNRYPFNNFLHHHVEKLIMACLESNRSAIIDHLFAECNIIRKFLNADKTPLLSDSNPVSNSIFPVHDASHAIFFVILGAEKFLLLFNFTGDDSRCWKKTTAGWAHWTHLTNM